MNDILFYIMIAMFIGILFMTINIVKNESKCENKQIIYRYIPRTFEEDQEDPVYVSDIYVNMFNNQSPWIYNVADIEIKKQESMRDFIVNSM